MLHTQQWHQHNFFFGKTKKCFMKFPPKTSAILILKVLSRDKSFRYEFVFNILPPFFYERLCKWLFTVRDNVLPIRCSARNENTFHMAVLSIPRAILVLAVSHHSFSSILRISIILIFRTRWCLFIPHYSLLLWKFYAQFQKPEHSLRPDSISHCVRVEAF